MFLLSMILCFSSLAQAAKKIEVQGLFSNKAVVSIGGKRHVLSVGETSPEGVKLISVDSRGARLELDGRQKQYDLGSISTVSTTFQKRKKEQEKIYVNAAGMYMTLGKINSKPVRFLIDTGASAVSMNAEQAKSLGISYLKVGKRVKVSTASGFAEAYRVRLSSVTIGRITQNNVEAVVISGNHPGPVLLGMTFLSRIDVQHSGKAMTLTQEN